MRNLTTHANPAVLVAAVLAGVSLTAFSDVASAAEPQEITITLQLKPVNPTPPIVRAKPEVRSWKAVPTKPLVSKPLVTKSAPQQQKSASSEHKVLKPVNNLETLRVPSLPAPPKVKSLPLPTSDSSDEGVVVPVYPRYPVITPNYARSPGSAPVTKPSTSSAVARSGKAATAP